MIIILLGLILIFLFFFDQNRIIFYVVIFYLVYDMFDGFYSELKIFPLIRYVLPLIILFFYILKNKALYKSDIVLLIYAAYLIFLITYIPGDLIDSIKNVVAILVAFLMIIIGRYEARSGNFFDKYKPINRVMLILLPVYIVMANVFSFGNSYTESFSAGFLVHSRMYISPILIFMSLFYLFNSNGKTKFIRYFDIGLSAINLMILLIITRRTSLGMLAVGIIVYLLINRQIFFKMVFVLAFFVIALVAAYPLYQDALTAQLEKRERIQNIDTYEEEGRYLETLFILRHHDIVQDPLEFFFGIKLFDTLEFGTQFFGKERPIHSDINMLFYSTGFIGLVLFFEVVFHYLILGIFKIPKFNRQVFYPLLMMFFLILIPGRFIGTFTFAPLLMLLLAGSKYSFNKTVNKNRIKENRLILKSS